MFALRLLLRRPGSSLLIVAMLALGIAGTTTIFSIFNGLFLRPLPFSEPERLADLDEVAPRWNLEFVGIAYPDFVAWRRDNQTFDSMAVWSGGAFNLSGRGAAERIDGARVTHDLLNVLRIRTVLGRGIRPEEDKPGGQRVVLLGYGLWQRMFGGRADILGQVLHLDAQDYTVVGVLPPEAQFPSRAELWVPLAVAETDDRGWWLNGLGRLKPGVTLGQARADLTRIHKGQIETRKVNEITSPKILPVRERYLGNFRSATRVVLARSASCCSSPV